jgi:amino acid transporter
MTIALVAGVAMALAALLFSWRAFDRTRRESDGDSPRLSESGDGRARFLALWGMLLGGGFALTTVITAFAFLVLPRCAG